MMKIHKMMMFLQIIKIKKNIYPPDLAAANHQKKIETFDNHNAVPCGQFQAHTMVHF